MDEKSVHGGLNFDPWNNYQRLKNYKEYRVTIRFFGWGVKAGYRQESSLETFKGRIGPLKKENTRYKNIRVIHFGE